MEHQLSEVQAYFTDETFRQTIDDILISYLEKLQSSFTDFQKNALPVCAAYYAICEANLESATISQASTIEEEPKQSQEPEKTNISHLHVSLLELRDKFFASANYESLLSSTTDIAQRLSKRSFSQKISTHLDLLRRLFRLFQKAQSLIHTFLDTPQRRHVFSKVIWRIFLLLRERIAQGCNIERCAYLLHFICTSMLTKLGKQPLQTVSSLAALPTISDQVNMILLKNLLAPSQINSLEPEFQSALTQLEQTLQATAASDKDSIYVPRFDSLIESEFSIDELNTLLEKQTAISLNEFQESEFLSPHEPIFPIDSQQQHALLPTTPKSKPAPSLPIGVTHDHQEAKNQNAIQSHTNQAVAQIPRRSLTFNDDNIAMSLNSKLSEIDMHQQQLQNQNQLPPNSPIDPLGLFAQPRTPGLNNAQQQHQAAAFKMPVQRSNNNNPPGTPTYQPPNTPISNVLAQYKWINVYSKQSPSKRIDELMAKVSKDYKERMFDEMNTITRDIFYNSRKKNEGSSSNGSNNPPLSPSMQQNEMQNKVSKTIYLFTNILEKMIHDEDLRQCKEALLLQLIENRQFIFALLANCIITICFVRDIKGVTLDYILKQCQISALDCWRVISNFAKVDRLMPYYIRENLFNTEKQILLYNIWEEKDQPLQKALRNFESEESRGQSYDKVICRRLINHCATRVKEICGAMQLNDEIQERVWSAFLHVLKHELHLLTNRYVDQILLCSIYALKLTKPELFLNKEIKFKSMLISCENLVHFQVDKVKHSVSSTNEQIDIIAFYNKIYLISMKVYFKNSSSQIQHQSKQATVFDSQASQTSMNHSMSTPSTINTFNNSSLSPSDTLSASLKDSIPANFILFSRSLNNSQQQKLPTTPMTPMSQQLHAHTEQLETPQYPQQSRSKQTLAKRSSSFQPKHSSQQDPIELILKNNANNDNKAFNIISPINFFGQNSIFLNNNNHNNEENDTYSQTHHLDDTQDDSPKFGAQQAPHSFSAIDDSFSQPQSLPSQNLQGIRALKREHSIFGINNNPTNATDNEESMINTNNS